MKTKITFLILALVGMSLSSAEAQFFKKLKDKVSEAAENAVINKAGQKTEEQVSKRMDDVFDMKFGGKDTYVDPSILPAQYDFTWKYTMRIENAKRDLDIEYLLKEDASYLAFNTNAKGINSKIIMDMDINTMIMLTDEMGFCLNMDATIDEDDDAMVSDMDFEIEKIGTKSILGHECQGYKFRNDEFEAITYIWLHAPVQLFSGGNYDKSNMPKNINPKLFDGAEKGLMMEMQFTNLKGKKKESGRIYCVDLTQEKNVIKLSDYNFEDFSAMMKAMEEQDQMSSKNPK